MDGRIDGWVDGWVDGWTDGYMYVCARTCVDTLAQGGLCQSNALAASKKMYRPLENLQENDVRVSGVTRFCSKGRKNYTPPPRFLSLQKKVVNHFFPNKLLQKRDIFQIILAT